MDHPDAFWNSFLESISERMRGPRSEPRDLSHALSGAVYRPDIYLVFGIHGAMLFRDAGYFEFDDPARAYDRLEAWCGAAGRRAGNIDNAVGNIESVGFPVGIEVGISSLEELSESRDPWPLLASSNVEILNPLYAQPYLRLIGEESNFRQFERGIEVLKSHSMEARVFASSEHALHPQVPQLLKGFGIGSAYAGTRLAGGSPAAYLPKVRWAGRDGSEVDAIVPQAGLPSGQVWHGRFFDELPALLFSAVSRPDLGIVVFVNIEDLLYDSPGFIEEKGLLEEFEAARIRVRHFSELFRELPATSRICSWSIEEFPIRYMDSPCIAACRKAENLLTHIQSVNSLLSTLGAPYDARRMKAEWDSLLIAENHDAFIVPSATPGSYTAAQGLGGKAGFGRDISIGEKSAAMAKDVSRSCSLIGRDLGIIGRLGTENSLGLDADASIDEARERELFAVNILWERKVSFGNRLVTVPACGFVNLAEDGDRSASTYFVQVETETPTGPDTEVLRFRGFQFRFEGKCVFREQVVPGIKRAGAGPPDMDTGGMSGALVRRFPDFLQVEGAADREQVLWIDSGREGLSVFLTYPFGCEPTSEATGNSLHFLWLDRKLVVVNAYCPYFIRTSSALGIRIPRGGWAFKIATAETLAEAYRKAWEYYYPPLLVRRTTGWPFPTERGSFVPIRYKGCVPTSIEPEQGDGRTLRMRMFSVDGSLPEGDFDFIDFSGRLTEPEPAPWRIHTVRYPRRRR